MYSFANLCRFCKKSDKYFIHVTSKMFREIRQFYNILSKNTDVDLNMCLQQVCQTCFKILINISDILLECNRTDNTVFRKYLAILKTNDKSHANYECIVKDQVINYADVNHCHYTIKKEFVKDLNGPSTSSEYNENIIKTEVADEYDDLHELEGRKTTDIIDKLKVIPNMCRYCKKFDKHIIDVTSRMFGEIRQIYNILSENMNVKLNKCLQQVCQTCFKILTNTSDILSECDRTDTVFRKYLAILKTNDKSYAICECVIKAQVYHHNSFKKEFVKDLNDPSTSNVYNVNIIKTEVADEYNEKSNSDLNHLEERNTLDIIDELKFIPNEDMKHLYLEFAGQDTLFNENNYNHQDDRDDKDDSQLEKFNNMTKLNRHVHNSTGKSDRSIHTNKRRFKCDICNKKFNMKGYLNIHKLVHTGELPFECNVCTKKFHTIGNLIQHKRIHTGEHPFECDVCDKKFNVKGNLYKHKLIHTNERRFECDVCNKKFNMKGDLNTHKRVHTGECPFECDVCDKKFKTKGNLIQHILIHTGECPFECDICNKKFNQKSSLNVHKRIHTGKLPFECNVCNKKFNRKGNLFQHKRLHTGELPFECEVCNKKFNQQRDLNRHNCIKFKCT